MKQGDTVGETFVCRSFTCDRNWEGTVGTVGNRRKDDHDGGSWALEETLLSSSSSRCYSSFGDYLNLPHCMGNWLEIVKPCLFCEWALTYAFVSWMWKSNTCCYLYWENGPQCLELSFQQQLQMLHSWCLSFSLFLWYAYNVTPSHLTASGTEMNRNAHVMLRYSSRRDIAVSLRKLVAFCSAEGFMIFLL